MGGTYDRAKRVRRLKKIILGTVAAAILIPTVVSIVLGVRLIQLGNQVEELQAMLEQASIREDEVTGIYTTSTVQKSPREEAGADELAKDGEEPQEQAVYAKQVYLTFDDGPSSNTDRILAILDEYGVKATFFVVGKTDEHSLQAYQKIVADGHTLGMHSYSHKYEEIYASRESFAEDMTKLQEFLYQTTGVWPRIYRFPGGSSNTVSRVDMQELIGYLNENGITYFDWNIASGDAVSGSLDADTIVNNCLSKVDGLDECVILLHDASDKDSTVEALPRIIEEIQARGDAQFLPITDETTPVQHRSAKQ